MPDGYRHDYRDQNKGQLSALTAACFGVDRANRHDWSARKPTAKQSAHTDNRLDHKLALVRFTDVRRHLRALEEQLVFGRGEQYQAGPEPAIFLIARIGIASRVLSLGSTNVNKLRWRAQLSPATEACRIANSALLASEA